MDKETHSNVFLTIVIEHQTDRHILLTIDLNLQFIDFNFYSLKFTLNSGWLLNAGQNR